MTYWDEYDEDDGWADEPYDGSPHDDWEDEPDDEPDDRGGAGRGRGGTRWLEVLVAVVAAVAVVVLIVRLTTDDDEDGDGDEVATADEDSTTSTSRRTTTTRATTSSSSTTIGDDATASSVAGTGSSTTKGSGGSGSGGSGGGSGTTKKPTTTQSTAPVYEDKDPKCVSASSGALTEPGAGWPEVWQTKPQATDPTTISICVDDWTPRVGQLITVSIRGDDPDALIDQTEHCGWYVSFNGAVEALCQPDDGAPTPRPTPAQAPGNVRKSPMHAFQTTGTFSIRAAVRSGVPGPLSPYGGDAAAALTVQVHA